jgi:hypothetical protein
MIADKTLPIKCVSLNAVGGYDTHSGEAATLSTNLGETIESVVAFQRDLEARQLDNRVLIQLWSERDDRVLAPVPGLRRCVHGHRSRHEPPDGL